MDRCKISNGEVVLAAPDIVNIPCLMHGIRLCNYVNEEHFQFYDGGLRIRFDWIFATYVDGCESDRSILF